MKKIAFVLIALVLIAFSNLAYSGDIPRKINYQGYVKEDGSAYTGTGYFLFGITDSAGTTYYWSNDGDEPPDSGVSVTVTDGVFSVLLGDTSLTNMTTIGTSVFTDNAATYLRVWFSTDGTTYEEITPKKEISSSAYSYNAYEAYTLASGSTIASVTITQLAGAMDCNSQAMTNANIDSGTADNLTSLTVANDVDIGAYDLTAATLTADGLTSGRVVFATTGGQLTDDADLTFATDTLTATKIGAFTLSGKLTGGASEIEGTGFDINGGTVDAITSLTVANDVDIGGHDLRAATLTADGLTSGRVVFATTNGQFTDDSDLTFATDTLTTTKLGATELTGELDCAANTVGFTQQTATGDGTTTIDWKLGNKFAFTFGAQNETFTFTAPTNECNLTLKLEQDGTGSRTATWPATVIWAGGSAPTLTTTASYSDIVTFYYDGTNYFGVASLNFDTD